MALSPSLGTHFEDFIDDLVAVYSWFKTHAGSLAAFLTLFEEMLNLSFLRPILNWLNPRRHIWNAVLLIGILVGAGLVLIEMTSGEGDPPSIAQVALLIIVFMGIEGVGVVLRYTLLGKPLRLFRHNAQVHNKASLNF